MYHPDPTNAEPQLFTSGSYGCDFLNSTDSGAAAPRQGWCILQCVTETVLNSNTTFGSDVGGGSKLIGITLPVGTFIWASFVTVGVTSGLVCMYRGKHQS